MSDLNRETRCGRGRGRHRSGETEFRPPIGQPSFPRPPPPPLRSPGQGRGAIRGRPPPLPPSQTMRPPRPTMNLQSPVMRGPNGLVPVPSPANDIKMMEIANAFKRVHLKEEVQLESDQAIPKAAPEDAFADLEEENDEPKFDLEKLNKLKENLLTLLYNDLHSRGEETGDLKVKRAQIRIDSLFELYKAEFNESLPELWNEIGIHDEEDFVKAVKDLVDVGRDGSETVLVANEVTLCDLNVKWMNWIHRPYNPKELIAFQNIVEPPSDEYVELGAKLDVQEIPDYIGPGQFFESVTVDISDPGNFHVQLRPRINELNAMMREMDLFYKDTANSEIALKPMPENVTGLLVAVPYFSQYYFEGWHRGVITEVKNVTEVSVKYIDYGTVADVEISSCRYLHKRFTYLPAQAIHCKLHGLIPPKGLSHWPSKSIAWMREYNRKYDLYQGYVTTFISKPESENQPMPIVLIDTTSNMIPNGINLNQLMLSRKLASPDPTEIDAKGFLQWQEEKKKMSSALQIPINTQTAHDEVYEVNKEYIDYLEQTRAEDFEDASDEKVLEWLKENVEETDLNQSVE